MDSYQTGNHKNIIQSAFDGWVIWGREITEPEAWLLQMYEGSELIEEKGKNKELILDLYACN